MESAIDLGRGRPGNAFLQIRGHYGPQNEQGHQGEADDNQDARELAA